MWCVVFFSSGTLNRVVLEMPAWIRWYIFRTVKSRTSRKSCESVTNLCWPSFHCTHTHIVYRNFAFVFLTMHIDAFFLCLSSYLNIIFISKCSHVKRNKLQEQIISSSRDVTLAHWKRKLIVSICRISVVCAWWLYDRKGYSEYVLCQSRWCTFPTEGRFSVCSRFSWVEFIFHSLILFLTLAAMCDDCH